jgi:hypothetical protein
MKQAIDNDAIKAIFEFWQQTMGHPRAKLDNARRRAIAARLREGYTIDEIKDAIRGCKSSAWHQGDNPSGVKYDDLTLICRSGAKLEHFRGYLSARRPRPAWTTVGQHTESEPQPSDLPAESDPIPSCPICGDTKVAVYKRNSRLVEMPCHRCVTT